MNRFVRAAGARFAVLAGALTLVLSTAPAGVAASACATGIIQDWSDNGRVDRQYALPCYEEAIDTIPGDLRDYTNATDVIGRALTAALRANGQESAGTPAAPQTAAAAPAASASGVPFVPLVGGVFALGVVLAGGAAFVARRRGAS